MRADMTAAFFDCRDTGELTRQVTVGEILRPTAERGRGRAREPLWALDACRLFVASRHGIVERREDAENIADLV